MILFSEDLWFIFTIVLQRSNSFDISSINETYFKYNLILEWLLHKTQYNNYVQFLSSVDSIILPSKKKNKPNLKIRCVNSI